MHVLWMHTRIRKLFKKMIREEMEKKYVENINVEKNQINKKNLGTSHSRIESAEV